MLPLYSTSQIRKLDSSALEQLKVPGIVLMENAALGIFHSLKERCGVLNRVGFVCGRGNNGGDGYAVARHFSNDGYDVKVISIGPESGMSRDCSINFNILKNLSANRKNLKIKRFGKIDDIKWLKDRELIFDAIIGSGFSGEMKEPISDIINSLNQINCSKCAIDVPTGLNADTGFGKVIFYSDMTVTLGEFKKGLFIGRGYEYCGEIIKKEIGTGNDYFDNILTDTYLIEPEDVYSGLPKRGKSVHKYSAGKVLTIAGSCKYPGAAFLTSRSALLAGAGASVLAIPEGAKKLIHKDLLEVVVESYGTERATHFDQDALKSLRGKISWADSVAVGPGLGREEETIKAVIQLLGRRDFNYAVIDADALFGLDKDILSGLDLSNCILTPHSGEFSRLTGLDSALIEKDILSYGREFAEKHRCILILKGAPTVIFNSEGEALINTTGNSGMAKFGTGDVLTGILAGLLSQIKDTEMAAVTGVYLHSLSADLLLKEKSYSNYLASDIMNNYPAAVKFLEGSIV